MTHEAWPGITEAAPYDKRITRFSQPATTDCTLQRANIMEFISERWIPILVGAVVLKFASKMAWMVLPHYFDD